MNAPLDEPRWFSLGPHGYFDLVRLARRGRSVIVRIAYVLVLYAALAVVYRDVVGRASTLNGLREGQVDRWLNVNARIAERFCITVLVTQNIAVLVLLPIYCAASIFEERDKRTLPILFTTHLTAREILLGKLASRVGHVGGILLAGLPVLAIAQLWGGIDMEMIAANFWNTALWLFSVGSLSLMIAAQSRSLLFALVKIYLLLGVTFCCCCLPLSLQIPEPGNLFLLMPFRNNPTPYLMMWVAAIYLTIAHVAAALFFLYRARGNLEALRVDEAVSPEAMDEIDETMRRHRPAEEVSDQPIAWKERYLEKTYLSTVMPLAVLPWLAILALPLIIFKVLAFSNDTAAQEVREIQKLFLFFFFASAGIYMLLVAIRLVGCIVRERDKQTLDGLLALPLERREILDAKVAGNMQRFRFWLWPLGLAWAVLQGFGDVNLLGGVLVLFALAVHFYFFAMLALFLSVVCRSSVAAYVVLGIVGSSVLCGTMALDVLADVRSDSVAIGLNPMACWVEVAFRWWILGTPRYWVEVTCNVSWYALSGVILHIASIRCFARQPP